MGSISLSPTGPFVAGSYAELTHARMPIPLSREFRPGSLAIFAAIRRPTAIFFRTFGVRAKPKKPLSLAREVQPCWAEFLSDLVLGGSMESAFLSSTPCCCIRSRLFKGDQFMRRAMVVFLVTVYRRYDAVTSADHGGGSGGSPSRPYVVGSNATTRRARIDDMCGLRHFK